MANANTDHLLPCIQESIDSLPELRHCFEDSVPVVNTGSNGCCVAKNLSSRYESSAQLAVAAHIASQQAKTTTPLNSTDTDSAGRSLTSEEDSEEAAFEQKQIPQTLPTAKQMPPQQFP